MNKKIIFLLPAILFLASIITSLVAFNYSNTLSKGYIYPNIGLQTAYFDGEYVAIIGNLGESSDSISVTSTDQGLLITVFDISETIILESTFVIKEVDGDYSQDLVASYLETPKTKIEENEDYIFTVDLLAETKYELSLEKTANNVGEEEIDIVLANIPGDILDSKNVNEGIAFTTFVFSILSLSTILIIIYVKK